MYGYERIASAFQEDESMKECVRFFNQVILDLMKK